MAIHKASSDLELAFFIFGKCGCLVLRLLSQYTTEIYCYRRSRSGHPKGKKLFFQLPGTPGFCLLMEKERAAMEGQKSFS
jgi:hypothetical protein